MKADSAIEYASILTHHNSSTLELEPHGIVLLAVTSAVSSLTVSSAIADTRRIELTMGARD